MLRGRPTTGIEWGLDRTRAMLGALDDPHESYATYHVGGTNGKGSVCLASASLLSAAGVPAGAYLSPHTLWFAERVRLPPDRRPAPPELLEECARRVSPLADRTGASRFEAITALGLLALAEAGVEAACVEVGLGGRLDATNVVSPRGAAVVTVGLDHAAFLGDTLPDVAREKAGIWKPGTPAVVGRVPGEAAEVLEERAREVEAPLFRLGRDARVEGVRTAPLPQAGTRFRYVSRSRPDGIELRVPAVGRHQAE
ncbi:MAG: bifunctional folylpolyglutamate synthase/dihydrofolate synthase, partial [Gemmatimonadota bacterium]